jgi:4-amino-4-deoxy-L-arabinose transferase-like glycosyltransferase
VTAVPERESQTASTCRPLDVRATVLAWGLAVVVTFVLVAVTHYESPDPDSSLHAGIAARLSGLPVARWIAPEWWGFWNSEGPYCEHPAGIFLLPAALGRLGYPPLQAAYAANAVYQAATFVLIALIAASVVAPREARTLGWILQLLPIAFVYRVRANHEYALLAGLLFAVYSTERARKRPVWTLGMVAGFGIVLLVKGVFAVIVPLTCAVWLLARASGRRDLLQDWRAWAAVAAMPAVGALAAWGYEAAYVSVTGRSFLAVYQSRQLPADAVTEGSVVWRTAYSAVWYGSRLFWYPFPLSLLAGVVAYRGLTGGTVWPWSRPHGSLSGTRPPVQQGAWFALAATVMLTGGLSVAHRKADRYLFAAYFLVAAVGAIEGINRLAWLRRLVERLDRPWVPAAMHVGLVILRLTVGNMLPEFTFWRT